ncbi:MAG: XdhC family protein [Microscillaceae bacterium]|nr:XdhC family protein [Microscillaceae bacterium]
MLDIIPGIENWLKAGKKFALATVIHTWRSAPRMVGSAMAIAEDMEILGSVSGGCVEGAVIKKALPIIQSGKPEVLRFGVSDEDAWSVGLSCGGAISVFVERFMAFSEQETEAKIWENLHNSLMNNRSSLLISALSEAQSKHFLVYPDGQFVGENPGEALIQLAQKAIREHKDEVMEYDDQKYFFQNFPKKDVMVIVGAAHISQDLITLANQFNFETIVIDPRGIFAKSPGTGSVPHQLHQKWPEEVLLDMELDAHTYAVLLTHDPKIDDQALHILLRSQVAYIGALGSTRTHEKRSKRLQEAGFSEAEIARIHGPVGVDIHALRPQEIALSIMAEVIQVKNQFL